MLTETQAWVLLGLARAQDLLDPLQKAGIGDAGASDAGHALPEAYWTAGATLVASMTSANLFDGTRPRRRRRRPGPSSRGSSSPGSSFSPTRRRSATRSCSAASTASSSARGRPSPTSSARSQAGLVQLAPAHSSLLTIVTDSNDVVVQQSYLRAGSQAFGYRPRVPGRRRGPRSRGPRITGPTPSTRWWRASSQLWHGAADDARCAP